MVPLAIDWYILCTQCKTRNIFPMKTFWTILFTTLSIYGISQDKFYLNSYNEILSLKVQGDKLWAGTTKGLVLRDKNSGEICGIFNHSNSPIPTNYVYDLEIGPDGNLWIATHENVVRFDGQEFHVEYEESLVTGISFDEEGTLITATRIFTEVCGINYNLGVLEDFATDGFPSETVSNSSGQNYIARSKVFCAGGGNGSGGCGVLWDKIQTIVAGDTIDIIEVSQLPGQAIFSGHINIDPQGNLYFNYRRSNELQIYNPQLQTIDSFSFEHINPNAIDFIV